VEVPGGRRVGVVWHGNRSGQSRVDLFLADLGVCIQFAREIYCIFTSLGCILYVVLIGRALGPNLGGFVGLTLAVAMVSQHFVWSFQFSAKTPRRQDG
jgi:hypothetical protein